MKLIRQLWYIFSPRERIEGLILLLGMALGALLEAGSIGIVAPFIAVLNGPKRVFDAPVAQPLMSALHIRTPQELLITLGIGVIGVFMIKSIYLVLLYRWLFRYAFDKCVAITRRLLTGYLCAPYTFHLQRNTAELIKGTSETIQRFIIGFLIMLLVVLAEALVVVALTALLVLFKPLATLGAVLILGVPAALTYRAMQRRLADSGGSPRPAWAR